MCSEFVDRFGAIVGRMACLFAVAVLFCVSSAHSQAIEEGGFPVKGGGVSGESFSLSCPSRLVVEAGESVALSCSATDIPEEGVRYGWESVSGEGLRLLSDAQVLSPLFAAPLSGAGEEYAYRLTAMAAGVYRTATVTVAVEGVPGETVGAPVVREECDSFTVPGELGEGCVEDKGPAPFGFGSEAEGGFLFPEAPGLPDRPSGPVRGGGSVMQAPPRLECPAAVFLEELETSVIECRVFDASGEEHLEYVWEPVGGTTRDYLENPRLIPEDSPTPSVVAPEAPVYETLESFRSVEPTFRYRYRLTATSRATGLSSRTEVEVFVSGSRPGVYCPLEVVVEEGATIALDCEGVDPLSGRMDYDEDGASIAWEWEGLWGASTALLDATDRSSPLFTAPAGSAGEAYHYIASMTSSASGFPRTARRRVTVRVVGEEEDVSGRMNNHSLTIPGNPFTVTEWQRNVEFGVQISHTNHDGILYELGLESIDSAPHALQNIWGGGGTAITFRARTDWNNISRQAPCVYADTTWEYKVCLIEQRGSDGVSDPFDRVSSCSEAALGERAIADLSITILDTGNPACPAAPPPPPPPPPPAVRCPDIETYEGAADITLDCTPTSEPPGATYSWTGRDIANRLSSTTELRPTFLVPEDVDSNKYYNYTITMSADGQERARGYVWIAVLDRVSIGISCAAPDPAYEGSSDITLDCTASGAPAGSTYEYVWAPRGATSGTSLLSRTDIASPVFYVPSSVTSDETYEYALTASARNAESATAFVTVRVLNRGSLAVACTDPDPVYEGSADVAFDCSASGASSGSAYAYSWRARGATSGTSLLSRTDIASPVFYVPSSVTSDETYEYALTASARNAESATAFVTVTVLKRGSLAVACTDPGAVYEGSADITLDCTASGAPSGSDYEYAWTARGGTANTDLLSATDGPAPTFLVPNEVDSDEIYEYLLTVSADNAESATAFVTVTVLKRGSLAVACTDPGAVYEGSADITLDCTASGVPSGSDYEYAWTARGGTANTDLLSATDGPAPTFLVPNEVDSDEIYEYLLTVSADNAGSATAFVTVTVLNGEALALACADPGSVYEGSEDIAFDCAASGAPEGSDYEYAWRARGGTANTDLLSATDGPAPTFLVPDEVDSDETYEYLLTVSAANAEDASVEVTVTVLNREALALACADSGSVYEGSADITLDCSASGAPEGSDYEYAWTARGDTQDMSLLSAVDMASPTFSVPDAVDVTTDYEYLLTVSAANAEDASAEVTVTVLNKEALALACADPGSVYEGSEDIAFDCEASGAPGDSPQYTYVWTARGDTQDTSLLSAADMASPVFFVPDEVDEDATYAYLLTVSADNAEDASVEVTVTVLNKGALAVVCADPGSVYEGSEDIAFDCAASGAPEGSDYEYAWAARGGTADMSLLSAADNPSPTFYVPGKLDATTTYEYLLTVSADNAEDASVEVTVTVLNKGALAVVCTAPGSVYEGSEDIAFDCSASGAPGDNPEYAYAWTARGDTQDTSLLSATDIATPTFHVPAEVDEDETYEYLLTAHADNAESATAFVTVTVLDRVQTPPSDPVSRPLASSSAPESAQPSSLGVTASASPLRFGVQSADTEASLDPMTDQLSTRVSGPYHAGRMTLAPDGGEALDENGEMDLSIELASPVVLRLEGGVDAASIVLEPSWSFAESCEQLSSQAIGSLYTETTLSEDTCRLLLFGGDLDLTDVLPGEYAGSMDVVLRSGESEETHSVEVDVTVVPAQRVITIGPGGVRFSTSREVPVGLTEEQNLSIYPDVAFLTEGKPHGAFELSNPSLIPLEISVSARFGYTEATENGREVVVEDVSESHLGDLSEVVDIYPDVLILMPGEKSLVRYGVQEGALAAMEEKGYAAFFDVASEPRQYVRSDRMPEEVSGDRTARVTMRILGVYVPGEGASQLRATLLSISYVGSLSATFLLETQDYPFVGEVVAYDGDGRELGRRETLVYTRSRVRIPLDRIPEEDAVFLRFAPRGSDRVPEPASVEWDAPRRDIGAGSDKGRARTPETLARKP